MEQQKIIDPEIKDMMRFMHDFAVEHERVPSIREIAKGMVWGIRRTRRNMRKLAEAGWIKQTIRGLSAPDWFKA